MVAWPLPQEELMLSPKIANFMGPGPPSGVRFKKPKTLTSLPDEEQELRNKNDDCSRCNRSQTEVLKQTSGISEVASEQER
jgi:hypothetical protein